VATGRRNCTLIAAGHGLDYRWPLLDVRLIAFFLAIPAEETVGPGGVERHLHREAVSNVLPEFVVRHGKAMGPPVRVPDKWLRDGPADEPVGPRYGGLNPAHRHLVHPERFERMMTAAAEVRDHVRSGVLTRWNHGSSPHVYRRQRQHVRRLDRWLSAVRVPDESGSVA